MDKEQHKHSENPDNFRALTQDEMQEVLNKYDRESSTRIFQGKKQKIMRWLLIAFSLFALAINTVWYMPVQQHRAIFLAAVLFLVYLLYPAAQVMDKRNNKIPIYDLALALISSGSFLYMYLNFETIVGRAGNYQTIDIVIAAIAILLLLEACRRVVGIPILVVVLCFLAYAYFGKYIPGYFSHRGFTLQRIISHMYYTTEGVIGTPLGVCSTFIFLFILFGSFLEKTGIGQFFIDVANAIAGRATGGPAKVAVIASALQGTISGSSVANTVSSGRFTIPMMRKMGYRPEFAAAVEAAASTGGQIMPPVMGAAAFLMAEMTNIPYSTIIIAAIVPAILYFTGIMLMVHFEAKKLHLQGLPDEDIPHLGHLMLTKWYLLLPLVVLVVMMMNGYTASRAALFAIVLSVIVSMFRADTRMSFDDVLTALENGARNIISVAVACGVAGIIVGTVVLTGLGLKLATGLLMLSNGHVLLALFFTMIASIILGMGVPTTANYVIMATITAPIVIKLGIPLLPAHMFVFYFGIVADITPPVALAAYAGSAIAHSNPLRTGVTATKLAIAAFIIPYIFALNPAMLIIDTPALEVITVVATSLIGMFGVAIGMEGYCITYMPWLDRIMAIAGGLTLIVPGLITDIIGFCLIAAVLALQFVHKKHYDKKGVVHKRRKRAINEPQE